MRLAFIMDPVSTVLVDADTTFAIMLEADRRGHEVLHCMASDVCLRGGRVFSTVRRARMQRVAAQPIVLGEPVDMCLEDVSAVLVRKDPPFDENYLWLTLLLEHLRGKTLVVNDPKALRNANEKLYATHFPEVMPTTIVDAQKLRIRAFVESIGGQAVIKPIDGHGGEGVFMLRLDDKNWNGIVEHVTRNGSRLAMVQAFIPEVVLGDKRILLVDGEPIGAIMRVPKADDVRSNIHVGGSVTHAEITDADHRIIDALRERLRSEGLYFVGLDVIGGKLTEVNVTSPTGIQQMSRLTGTCVEGKVIDWLEQRAV